jgi:hypothetical protein
MPMTLTVTLLRLEFDVAYNLYRYDNHSNVPTRNFNGESGNAIECIRVHCPSVKEESSKLNVALTTSYELKRVIQSHETAIFRAVKASAP